MLDPIVRFFKMVNKSPDGCWRWMGTTYRGGYGHFRLKVGDKWIMKKAHRYSYEIHKGQIPEGKLICHTCDNPWCVNPDHLFIGNHQENVQDKIKKGRHSWGRNKTHHWLDKTVALQIREVKERNPKIKNKEISKIFDISAAQVSRILNHKIWK